MLKHKVENIDIKHSVFMSLRSVFSVSERKIGKTLEVCTASLLISKAITEQFEGRHKRHTFICVFCSRPKQAEKPREMSCALGQGSCAGCWSPSLECGSV